MEKNQCLESLHCSSFFDERGSLKTFRQDSRVKLPFSFVDCYITKSPRGVFRGLHLQLSDEIPLKYIKPTDGSIVLIALCLDPNHEEYCKLSKLPVNSQEQIAVVIQPMHAIGYLVQSEYAEVFVASSVSYQADREIGVNVLTLKEISILVEGCILSEKDQNLPSLQEVLIQLNSGRFE